MAHHSSGGSNGALPVGNGAGEDKLRVAVDGGRREAGGVKAKEAVAAIGWVGGGVTGAGAVGEVGEVRHTKGANAAEGLADERENAAPLGR